MSGTGTSSSTRATSGSVSTRGNEKDNGTKPGDGKGNGHGNNPGVGQGNNNGHGGATNDRGHNNGNNGRGKGATSNAGGSVHGGRGMNPTNSYDRQTQGPNDVRFDRGGKRVHPKDRPYMDWHRPGHFYAHSHPHYYGYRVHYLPHYRRVRYWGIDYYFYNDIWYRWYGGYYIVCRPPYGYGFARDLYDLELDIIRFSYYNNVYRSYTTVNSNYSTIQEQNKIIAENNALIAQQNATIAQQNATIAEQNSAIQQGAAQASEPTVDMNTLKAMASYNLATKLGLIQSYAAADSEYYYDDGVFFVLGSDGQYKTIVPPAGALIKALPDDYDMVTLSDGNEYYKVDDTIYRMTVTDGVPYFEVLGQMQS